MTDYSNQNITGLNLSNQNLTGANFTNANATNVNFTNAIITNAIFKNTLITGATLTGITFSDLQKGHLLLRAANQTNTAVNNLTALTPAEFLIIQPAVSTDTIARISTVTVKIPNSQGEGFIVSVTPVISQLVCIFVATNQNILITTGATQIRTIRSNGTVVQDVSNGNTTLNYLKIDSISYRLTVGNGDGVIAMIPVDLNVYQVNGSGLGDIVSLNLGSASTTLNMNNNGITNVSSIQGWNVKEITAGTGVGVTATNGSYAISNTAVVRDISEGTGITVSKTNGVATITNTAVVRDVGAGTGISVSTTGGVATITNTAVVRDVGAGTGITVSTTGGVATITNSAVVRDVGAGTGISVSTTNGVATITNSAVVRDISAGTGISVSTTNGVATITNSAVVRDISAGTGITVSTSNGVATITNTLTNDVVLWFSGAIDITTITSRIALPFTSAGKIDLANYHIQYEIDINWNLETDPNSPSHPTCYISMGFFGDPLNNVAANNSIRAANTIWTRKTNNSTASFPLDIASTTFDQAFSNVFLCGYASGQYIGEAYRYRTMMKGEISRATTRPAQYSGDFAPNSRLVMNRFYSDAVLYDSEAGTDALEFYHPTVEGQGQHHIQGTAVWEMNRENKYSVIQNGIDGLLIDLNNTASGFAAVPRRGYITYMIYRVKK